MLCISVLAAGAAWEARALAEVESASGMVVLRRCVDLDDLLASVTTGQVDAAVTAADVVGLDAVAVAHLRQHGVAVVAVLDRVDVEQAREGLGRAGIRTVVGADEVDDLPAVLRAVCDPAETSTDASAPGAEGALDGPSAATDRAGEGGQVQARRTIAVWGPVGAPGRTTVATSLGGLLAARGRPCVVVDADPNAAVAQHLGVTDQVSGLLSAARLWTAGTLPGRVQGACRALGPRLAVLTGVPRPDRREEVPPGALVDVVAELTTFADVVIDLGSELDAEAVGRPGAWATEVLESVDEVVVVGAADPVGLTRLAHALVELRDACGDLPVSVVVNRTRPTLGWSEREVAELVARVIPVRALHFLPDDRVTLDRALVMGECASASQSAFSAALGAVLDALHPETASPQTGRRTGRRPFRRVESVRPVTQRRAGTALQR